jgi:hypothetical protein
MTFRRKGLKNARKMRPKPDQDTMRKPGTRSSLQINISPTVIPQALGTMRACAQLRLAVPIDMSVGLHSAITDGVPDMDHMADEQPAQN